MWLEVVGRYGDEVVYSSGRWIDGQGLEGDAQQRTYEAVAVQQATGKRFHLLLDDTWVVDSRIPPLGLGKNLETDPVGDRYALLPDQTWPNFDDVSYAFPAASVVDATPEDAGDDVMALSVRLLYVINTPEYVEFLADENLINSAGQDVVDLYAGIGPVVPLVVAEWGQSVPLTGLMVSEPGSSSGSGGEPGTGSSGGAPTTGGGLPTSGGEAASGSSGGPGGTSTGTTDGAGGEGGCGCRTDARGAAWAGLFGVLGLAAGRRRRR